MELEEKQDIFRSLQDTAELLALENHPAKQTVEVSGCWGQQICACSSPCVPLPALLSCASSASKQTDSRQSVAHLCASHRLWPCPSCDPPGW